MPISDEQAAAYLATEYNVFTPKGRFTLRAFRRSSALHRLQLAFNVAGSAFLTAYNPYSELSDEAINRSYQDQLIAEVTDRWKVLFGEGVDPQGRWRAEPSVLVLGISREEAIALGKKYRQNAILVADEEGSTMLLACNLGEQATILRQHKTWCVA
jgi:hypothetical protein